MIRPPYLSDKAIHQFIDAALAEDIGEGDYTTLGSVSRDTPCRARLLVKDDGKVAGLELAEKIFQRFDPGLRVEFFKKDGEEIKKGDVAFVVHGSARSILSTERVVLNCLQRMSGIATYTDKLCRLLEKWAVAIGGGKNHRYALYDMVMLKDNHIDLAGGIQSAIENVKRYFAEKHANLKIEVETRTLGEVEEVLRVGGVDVIMLDNMSNEDMKKAVKRIAGQCRTEASGGIHEVTLRDVAECGVDYISMGAL